MASYKASWRDVARWLIHVPVGAIIAFLIIMMPPEMGGPAVGVVAAAFFGLYEVLEDWRVKDRSFKDIFGSLLGMIAMAGFLLAWYISTV